VFDRIPKRVDEWKRESVYFVTLAESIAIKIAIKKE
jgi:hypothetical protein